MKEQVTWALRSVNNGCDLPHPIFHKALVFPTAAFFRNVKPAVRERLFNSIILTFC